ncbi:hypothetical protein AAG747_14135 [Rapidithrix thailandica]|uniref:Uncharacterized protein n=1 Tax=Rapidithrix thailandica TaxID=413964 RepID=A0AAW9RW83_9BACT
MKKNKSKSSNNYKLGFRIKKCLSVESNRKLKKIVLVRCSRSGHKISENTYLNTVSGRCTNPFVLLELGEVLNLNISQLKDPDYLFEDSLKTLPELEDETKKYIQKIGLDVA